MLKVIGTTISLFPYFGRNLHLENALIAELSKTAEPVDFKTLTLATEPLTRVLKTNFPVPVILLLRASRE